MQQKSAFIQRMIKKYLHRVIKPEYTLSSNRAKSSNIHRY